MKHLIKSFFLMPFCFLSILFISCDSPSNPQTETENSSTNSIPTSPQMPSSPETPVVTYTVSFVTEHGTLPDSIKNGISVKENTLLSADKLPSLSADGYAFGGWYDGETLVVANEYKVTKNVTFTGKWTVATVSYTVSFVSAHETAPQAITLPKNTILTEENAPTLSEYGYRFDGWYDGENKIEVGSYKIEKNVELTAKWTACWIIHFDPNGGTGTMSDQLVDEDGKKHQLKKNTFVREGYTFIGWKWDSLPTTDSVPSYLDDEYIMTINQWDTPIEGGSLCAMWEPITYTVRFDTNRGVYEDIQVTYDESHTYYYGSTEFSQNGIYVSRWNTKSDGTGESFTTGEGLLWRNVTFNDISTQNGAVISLYAQWETSSYTIILDNEKGFPRGGVTENGENKVYINLKYGESYTLENPFILYRYYVTNWNRKYYGHNKINPINETYENGCVLTNLSSEHGDFVTLTPVWAGTSYRIHFDANGGTGRDWYEITGYYDEEVTLPENVYTRSGYTFICWEGGYPVGSKALNLGNPGDLIYVKAIWAKTNANSDFTLTIDAPAKNAAAIVERLSDCGTYTLNLSGECDEETIIQLGTKLKEKTMTLELHLEDTEGLTKISGLSECTCLKTIYLPNETRIAANALYGCTNLQAVYFPNYITNSSYYTFSARGENGTNNIIFVRQYSNGKSDISSTFQVGTSFSAATNAYEVLASLLVKKFWNGYSSTEFEGYKYEWRAE